MGQTVHPLMQILARLVQQLLRTSQTTARGRFICFPLHFAVGRVQRSAQPALERELVGPEAVEHG